MADAGNSAEGPLARAGAATVLRRRRRKRLSSTPAWNSCDSSAKSCKRETHGLKATYFTAIYTCARCMFLQPHVHSHMLHVAQCCCMWPSAVAEPRIACTVTQRCSTQQMLITWLWLPHTAHNRLPSCHCISVLKHIGQIDSAPPTMLLCCLHAHQAGGHGVSTAFTGDM
jgi:hypothetical protein